MGFETQAIRYGWTALASLGIITGTTIYVINNQRKQIKPEDVIQIALAVHERCLATQYATNPLYRVTPPSIVRTWKDTNNANVIVTNTIGWHVDRAMMVELDEKIKALVPWYADRSAVLSETNPVENSLPLTFTGLLASLNIGDGTNFTRTPAWTNTVSTNWIIDYTSYWPSTNGTPTNVIYTSDYQQVVNYAESWTATGGHVWVTASNWASEVVTITNNATYGDYPWQIYVEDLQERYKVLSELTRTIVPLDSAVNCSWRNFSAYIPEDGVAYTYSNTLTGVVGIEYYPLDYGHVFGLPYIICTNAGWLLKGAEEFTITYEDAKDIATWRWSYKTNLVAYSDFPPFNTNQIVVSTNDINLAAGAYLSADKFCWSYSSEKRYFTWGIHMFQQYATWRMVNATVVTSIPSSEVMLVLKPRADYFSRITEIATNEFYTYSREIDITVESLFEEMANMKEEKFYKFPMEHVTTNGNYLEIVFGSDQFDPMALDSAFPSHLWPEEPPNPVDLTTGNEGTIEYIKGAIAYLAYGSEQLFFGIRDWQFNYATNRYWE